MFFSVSAAGNLYVSSSDRNFTPVHSEIAGATPLKDVESLFSLPQTAPLTEDSSSVGESVAVSADPSQAVGKISRQFLSPYHAGLKYNNVYIKNSCSDDIFNYLDFEYESSPNLTVKGLIELYKINNIC